MQRNEVKERMGNEKKNVRNILQKLIGLILQTNSSVAVLKGAVMNVKAMLFSQLVTVRQNLSLIENPVKHLRWSFLQK